MRSRRLIQLARRSASALLALALASAPGRASASAEAKLIYVRGPGAERCPDEQTLRAAVRARVGYEVFLPSSLKTVVVEVAPTTPRGYRGRVQIVDERGLLVGERAMESKSDDCSDLIRALALAISIATDDGALDSVVAAPASPPPLAPSAPLDVEPPAALSPAVAPPGGPPVEPPATRGARLAVSIGPTWNLGAEPAASFGGEATVSLQYPGASLGVDVRADIPSSTAAKGGRVRAWLVAASLAPCLRLEHLFACVLGGAGSFTAEGTDIAAPHSQSAAILLVGGRLGLEAMLGERAFVVAHGDLLGLFPRHSVQIDGENVFQIGPVSASLGVGAGLLF